MRNPNRIYGLTRKLEELWALMPDSRLGQVISFIQNLVPVNDGSRLTSTFHLMMEDHIWEKYLDEAIAKLKEEQYNYEKKEREYIDESSKRTNPSNSDS